MFKPGQHPMLIGDVDWCWLVVGLISGTPPLNHQVESKIDRKNFCVKIFLTCPIIPLYGRI